MYINVYVSMKEIHKASVGDYLKIVRLCASLQAVFLFLFLWPHHATCRILVPRTGIKLVPPAVEAQSLNHWTTREVCKLSL